MPVIVDRVHFDSAGARLVGDLYLPETAGEPPVAVVAGSWTTVKEQMAGRYARGLAERGIAALAFDFRGFGESEGWPRDAESPAAKTADLVAAARFLCDLPSVEGTRVGALGVCAGAGYVACAAASFHRIGLVAPWLHDRDLAASVYGGADGVRRRVELGERAARKYRETGVVDYVPAVSATDPDAAMHGSFEYYVDTSRGAVPQWPNRFAVLSWPDWLSFDPISAAREVVTPTVMVHSQDAAIPDGARRFHEALAGPKVMHWRSGTQFDFYDDPTTVAAALDLVAGHLA
jgi:fermentation-respiration switch protein FrsA (DUF1100 family)